MSKYHQVRKDPKRFNGWRLYYGDDVVVEPVEDSGKQFSYPNVAEAKDGCLRKYAANPVKVPGDGFTMFSGANPLHAALLRLERREGGDWDVMAVGPRQYIVRRSKYGAEVAVNYVTCTIGGRQAVAARAAKEEVSL